MFYPRVQQSKKRVPKKDRLHLSPGKSVSLMELPSLPQLISHQDLVWPNSQYHLAPALLLEVKELQDHSPWSPERRERLNSKQEAPKVLAVQDSTHEEEVPVELEVGGYYFVKLKTAKTKPLYALAKLTDFVNDDYVKMQLYNMIWQTFKQRDLHFNQWFYVFDPINFLDFWYQHTQLNITAKFKRSSH